MTRAMAYAFATYYDATGRELDAPPFGAAQMHFLARALQKGPVLCSLHRLPDDIKARLAGCEECGSPSSRDKRRR
jgi:L-aspartate oxidase